MRLKAYAVANLGQSTVQLLMTLLTFAALWSGMWLALDVSYAITLLLSVPAASFLIRLFVIQHDCGHQSYFNSAPANDWVGRALGVLTLTPYGYWRNTHAAHHATSGNLDRRGIGDITTLTVEEYRALSPLRRQLYKLYRNPIILFGLVPTFLFVILRRLPIEAPARRRDALLSIIANNVALVGLFTAMIALIGVTDFIKIQLPIMVVASTIGVWLFFVQHQFEHGYWRAEDEWDFEEAALHGSSYLRLPKVLQWLTANIGLHHVHHLSSRIPNYRLQACLDRFPELSREARQISLIGSFKCAALALWCEERQRLVRFREIRNATGRLANASGR